MQRIIIQIVLFTLVFYTPTCFGQNSAAQDDYIKSSQEKHDFNSKKWSDLKKTISSESGGRYSSEEGEEGSFYQYDEEGYDGGYSEYKNDDEQYSHEGDEYGDGSGGGSGYHPKQDKTDYGQQDYHPKNKKEEREYRRKRRNNSSSYNGGGSSFLTYFLFGLLILLIAFLIFQLFMKSSAGGDGKKIEVQYEDLEPTQIPKSELELLLEKAIAKNDFRGAIRIYFIFIIKDLSEKEWIRWEKKKTNFSYLIEMRGKPQYESFNDAVSIYELAWYGNYRVNKEDFHALEPRFKNLLTSLNSAGK